MESINIHLAFNGNAEEAINFYKSVFGGTFEALMRYKEGPKEMNVPAKDQDKIMHASLPIGKVNLLMVMDSLEPMGNLQVGNNFFVSAHPDTKEEAERIFHDLSAGGKVTMALQDTFWNAYFGMLTDKFGIQWMVNYQLNQQK